MKLRKTMRAIIAAATITQFTSAAFAKTIEIDSNKGNRLTADVITSFEQPWAMTFLPDRSLIVTTKPGRMFHVTGAGKKLEIRGLPKVDYGGQGGLGDVILHPNYAENNLIYFSYVSGRSGKRGAEVARAELTFDGSNTPRLKNTQVIWKQTPKVTGKGHYSHRLVFGPANGPHAGKLFITSGDRQKRSPAQDMSVSLGKIIRLNDDGSLPADNPWANGEKGKLARSFWTTGHRNMLGIAFDQKGQLWATEMGPRHGDELNFITPGENYGWPIVSNGTRYSGLPIPDHDTRPEFAAPKAYWIPSIAPSGLIIYSGKKHADWQGDAFIGGLVSRALVRVKLDGQNAEEVERFEWGKRVREVEQDTNGEIWVLEDRSGGRLLKLNATNN